MNRFFLFLISFSFFMTSCTNEEMDVQTKVSDKNAYFKENVAFLDARIRSIGQNDYVREVLLKDFSVTGQLPASIGFENAAFVDNGLGNDAKAGDGIYTSTEVYTFKAPASRIAKGESKSVLEEVIIDKSFKFRDQLNSSLKEINQDVNNPGLETRGPVATIECDVQFGTKGCYAQEWGWCESCCVTVSNCRVKIGWE